MPEGEQSAGGLPSTMPHPPVAPGTPPPRVCRARSQVQLAGRYAPPEPTPSVLLRLSVGGADGADSTEHLLQVRPHALRATEAAVSPRALKGGVGAVVGTRRLGVRAHTQPVGARRQPHARRWSQCARSVAQADLANLRRLSSELEAALREERSTHSRRIQRRL